jgi:hypothetical protein
MNNSGFVGSANASSLTRLRWWKAKLKDEAGVTDGAVGLIPATYVEEVSVVSHLIMIPADCVASTD